MYQALSWIMVLAAIVMGFIGVYGLVEAPNASTDELQEDQFWVAIALIAGAVGLLAGGLSRVLPATRR